MPLPFEAERIEAERYEAKEIRQVFKGGVLHLSDTIPPGIIFETIELVTDSIISNKTGRTEIIGIKKSVLPFRITTIIQEGMDIDTLTIGHIFN